MMLRLNPDHVETDRLVLRRPAEVDIPRLVKLANNRVVAENLCRMPHPYDENDARTWFEELNHLPTGAAVFAIGLKAEGNAFIGACGYFPMSGEVDLGYWLGEPYWRRGYAFEAAAAVLAHAFEVTGLDYMTAGCRPDNPASQKVLVKLGFQSVGRGTNFSKGAGRVLDMNTFTLAREQWLAWPREARQGSESVA